MALDCRGLLLNFLLITVLQQACFASHCVMRGFCGENDYGKATCSYNGTAVALEDEEALEILKEICPDVIRESNLLCCDAEQVVQLRDQLEIAATLGLARRPSCLSNFRKLFCQFECSPRQSDFMKVTALAFSDEDDLVIDRMSYYMSHRYANGMFDSCKDIEGLTPGSTVLDLMCGGWGRECNAKNWLNFMGSTPANNGFSPFEINYHLTSESQVIVDGQKYFPMNESTLNFMASTPASNGFSPSEINYHLTSESQVIVDGQKYFPMNENTNLCSECPYPGAPLSMCMFMSTIINVLIAWVGA